MTLPDTNGSNMNDDSQRDSVDDLRRQFDGLLELVTRYQQKDRMMVSREWAVEEGEVSLRDRLKELVPREADLARREAALARRETLQMEREAVFMAEMDPMARADSRATLGALSDEQPPGEHSQGESVEILKRRLVAYIQDKRAHLEQLQDLKAKVEAEVKKAREATAENAALQVRLSGLERELQSLGTGPWISPELLEFLSTTEPRPEEAFTPLSRVVTLGSGPYPKERFDQYLRACGIKPCQEGSPWIIVGRDAWSAEHLHECASDAQRIFSQEMFALAMITGRDPFDWPGRVLFPLASGHPALEFLDVTSGIWEELIEMEDDQDDAVDCDEETEALVEDQDADGGENDESTDEGTGGGADEEVEAADDEGPLFTPAFLSNALGMVDQSPLHAMGYQVGAKRGLSEPRRRTILEMAYQGRIPPTGNHGYMMEWGPPGTPKRLWRIAHHLASLVRLQSSKVAMWHAVSDWRGDLEWLREKFYDATCQRRFRWPEE